jgi:putative flippase GtrA
MLDFSLRTARAAARRGVAGQFLVFSAVGAVGTTAHYCVLIVLHEFLAIAPVPASAVGFTVGALVNYALNYHVTFQSDAVHAAAMPKFYLIATVGFLLNIAVMWLMVRQLQVHYIAGQLVATGLVLAWGFAANSVWTFGEAKRRNTGTGTEWER